MKIAITDACIFIDLYDLELALATKGSLENKGFFIGATDRAIISIKPNSHLISFNKQPK